MQITVKNQLIYKKLKDIRTRKPPTYIIPKLNKANKRIIEAQKNTLIEKENRRLTEKLNNVFVKKKMQFKQKKDIE